MYLSGACVLEKRPLTLTNLFWRIVNIIGLFFTSLWPANLRRRSPVGRNHQNGGGGGGWSGGGGGGGSGGGGGVPSNRHTATQVAAATDCPAAGG